LILRSEGERLYQSPLLNRYDAGLIPGANMRRREFLGILSGATVWPFAVRAQQPTPVIGFLSLSSAEAPAGSLGGLHLGLRQAGFEIGQSVRLEHRYANNNVEQLPVLARELVDLPATVIVTSGGPGPALAAKAASATTPIVFAPVPDPVRIGLVASLNRPGGNITGVAALTIELDPKRLELLHELAPPTRPLGVLLNPTRPDTQLQADGIKAAAQLINRELVPANASSRAQIDDAFASFARHSIGGVLIAADPFFTAQRTQIVARVLREAWPAVYQWREFADAGGLASFGPSLTDSYRQAGLFVARILKGEKPADLPVQQPTKFELVINLKTAKALGLSVPLALLGRADEVIE
jgi:putative tryptophan/tyrosine transport system substrate-binding protein